MLIVVDPHSGIPVFRQLVDQIRFHVASGLLKPGDVIPSTRTLAASVGVNPMTVSKAFGLLEAEGLVERRPGLPLVVKEQPVSAARQSRLDQLRVGLEPAATMAHQLGLPTEDAVEIFRLLLEPPPDPEE